MLSSFYKQTGKTPQNPDSELTASKINHSGSDFSSGNPVMHQLVEVQSFGKNLDFFK